MKKMKFSYSILVGVFFSVASPQAFAASTWAQNVNRDGGWVDTNKVYNPCLFWNNTADKNPADFVKNTYAKTDRSMCWLAAASNILQYFYIEAGGSYQYSSTYNNPIGGGSNFKTWTTNVRQNLFMEQFVANYEDRGGSIPDAISWYATGRTAYIYGQDDYWQPIYTPTNLRGDAPNPGGFNISTSTDNDYFLKFDYQLIGEGYGGNYIESPNAFNYLGYFNQGLSTGPIGLSIDKRTGDGWAGVGHALTCWGIEGDGQNITKMYITDSDDGVNSIIEINITKTSDGLLNLDKVTPINYRYHTGDTENLYYGEGNNMNEYYIKGFNGYENLFVGLIPEPSTASLFAGAVVFALVGGRKRRK